MALAGVALTGYLSYSHWADGALLYCTQGSACALVQSSRWSTLLGVPTAFWGFLTYCALAIIAATVKAPVRHWRSSMDPRNRRHQRQHLPHGGIRFHYQSHLCILSGFVRIGDSDIYPGRMAKNRNNWCS